MQMGLGPQHTGEGIPRIHGSLGDTRGHTHVHVHLARLPLHTNAAGAAAGRHGAAGRHAGGGANASCAGPSGSPGG